MALSSIAFAYFFLLVFTGAWLLRGHHRARNGLLLLASYGFYCTWHVELAFWLLALSLVDWLLGNALQTAQAPRRRRLLLAVGLALNVGLLVVFKLYDFFRESLERVVVLAGLEAHLPALQLLAPVGLSFYTFQGIAYLVDCYRGQAVRAPRLLDFLLFMVFFPKLLAGPICRSYELLPQLAWPSPPRVPDPERAALLVLVGLFKKVVLAAYLSTHLVGDVFQMPASHPWPVLVLALLAYSAEIYFDFSGYTDLARGLALLLGFELPENFQRPYAARNIGEFWRRWHMSFSRFLVDYVYFPLGGSRAGEGRTRVNLMLTMLLSGLWHGASWNFVIWGLLHGVALVVHRGWRRWPGRPGAGAESHGPLGALLGCVATITFCALARVFFRCEDLGTALAYFTALARPSLTGLAVLDPGVVFITALCFAQNPAAALFDRTVAFLRRLPQPALPIACTLAGILLLVLWPRETTPHIYFGF